MRMKIEYLVVNFNQWSTVHIFNHLLNQLEVKKNWKSHLNESCTLFHASFLFMYMEMFSAIEKIGIYMVFVRFSMQITFNVSDHSVQALTEEVTPLLKIFERLSLDLVRKRFLQQNVFISKLSLSGWLLQPFLLQKIKWQLKKQCNFYKRLGHFSCQQ